jgi:hypothetical protein
MAKLHSRNNVLRIELDAIALALRLNVTPEYIRYLLRGMRFNVPMLRRIHEIVVQEKRAYQGIAFDKILSRLEGLIKKAEEKNQD